ncbi:TPA: CDP-glycerol glycerophosphotransferase family protein [Campylobacter jejuni]|nr:CDP-glycerol glycerophosphotransferase family protein [Campylobacter jejuni]
MFKQDSIKLIKELKNETPSGNTSLFLFDIINKYNIKFPETSEARANFEDVRFAYEYFLNCLDKYAVILTKAIYYLRKRKDSTTAISLEKKEYYLGMPKQLIELCELSKKYRKDVTIFEQNIVLYHTFWHVFKNINCPEKLFFLSNEEKKEYLNLIKKSLEYVDRKSILFFSLIPNFNWFYKVGFLYCFKNEEPFFNVVYIEKYDSKSNQLLLRYYTCKDKDVKKVFIGMKEVEILDEKITKSDLLGNLFVYTKRFWISLPDSHFWNDNLEIFIDQKRAMVGWNNFFDSIKHIVDGVKKDNNLKEELWLFIDREFCADDNAEHLYRYIMKNHPNQKIAFILRKRSKDWTRLKNEGFNLLDFESLKFKKYVKKSTKIISSSADDYFLKYFKNKNFIFLQHGVIKDDLSFWLNSKNIDLFVTSTYPEYYSIISNYNRYKFTRKEVVLTGLPRYDVLKKNNNSNTKNIFLMPTWRQYLVNSNSDFFMKSRYYRNYDSLFKNIKLQKICSKYNYNILFLPHPNMAIFNNYFKLPKYVTLTDRNKGIQYFLQNSDILITDYSSIAFDMAFLEKPIIYYQFDRDEFFLKHSYQKGYFDYNKDAFGPVVFQESELLEQLERLLRNNSKLEDIYKNRINNAFVFKDQCNCERIYNKILEV